MARRAAARARRPNRGFKRAREAERQNARARIAGSVGPVTPITTWDVVDRRDVFTLVSEHATRRAALAELDAAAKGDRHVR